MLTMHAIYMALQSEIVVCQNFHNRYFLWRFNQHKYTGTCHPPIYMIVYLLQTGWQVMEWIKIIVNSFLLKLLSGVVGALAVTASTV
jgi:hypothetical protein